MSESIRLIRRMVITAMCKVIELQETKEIEAGRRWSE